MPYLFRIIILAYTRRQIFDGGCGDGRGGGDGGGGRCVCVCNCRTPVTPLPSLVVRYMFFVGSTR